ncbi:LysR family transcriptional regulator [Paracoccus sp. YLB-12]|uniref:LysR family transcriptional regulator n=1 Tax=Paracoccus maritimus TaxID=2933292 RepID=A0ABT2K6U5_9RHOB|nr:LysR family transcriptional regulator [Paracoccus sp. YLB-12]MCT4332136.1 LysR family transcriptional regulator [Paracoccus sp. YLB-12]
MDVAVLRCFVSVLEEGGFAPAARRIGISRSLCSKYISDLEADLGTRLFTRTTRSVVPTAAGTFYATRVRDALRRLDEATEAVRAVSGNPAGPLKIGSPIAYTLKILQPHLLRFMETYPDIRLEVVLDDGRTDLIGEGYDAVIRIGQLEDSMLLARRLQEVPVMLVAAPAYLEADGIPQEPADLLRHRCLHYSNLRGAGTWPMQRGREMIHQRIQPVFSSNNGEMLRAMAVGGKGIAMLPQFVIGDEIEQGHLVSVLEDYRLPDLPISLVYPSRKLITAAMRHFLDFMENVDLRR